MMIINNLYLDFFGAKLQLLSIEIYLEKLYNSDKVIKKKIIKLFEMLCILYKFVLL